MLEYASFTRYHQVIKKVKIDEFEGKNRLFINKKIVHEIPLKAIN
jgi:hypothetical protein